MTTYVTPFGHFCFQTLPQGISDSMDGFNISTDYIIQGIPKVLKSVDDLLGQGCNPQEIYDQIRPILIKIIENKFKLSKAKFKISTQLNFGGYTIEAQKSKTNNETQVRI